MRRDSDGRRSNYTLKEHASVFSLTVAVRFFACEQYDGLSLLIFFERRLSYATTSNARVRVELLIKPDQIITPIPKSTETSSAFRTGNEAPMRQKANGVK